MELLDKLDKDTQAQMQKKTVSDLLKENGKTSGLLTQGSESKPVSIIILCGDKSSSDTKIMEETNIRLDLEDDLLGKIRELQEENMRLQSLSLIDNLTGLYNNRFFRSQLEMEMTRTKRTGHPCALIMIDLDNFKLLNDTCGHLEGDRFLSEFGRIMHDAARATDLIFRYGGDEFAVIMPATSAYEACRTAERFKKRLGDIPQKTEPAITLSIGISEFTRYSSHDINEFIHAADMSMYEAKKDGKNRICIDGKIQPLAPETGEVKPDERESLLKDYI